MPAKIKKIEIISNDFGREKDLKLEASIVIGKAKVKIFVTKLAGAKESALYQVKT